jgi:hypothetical protein
VHIIFDHPVCSNRAFRTYCVILLITSHLKGVIYVEDITEHVKSDNITSEARNLTWIQDMLHWDPVEMPIFTAIFMLPPLLPSRYILEGPYSFTGTVYINL